MIIASLLLILVAVTLLVLGLAGGSSSLLTSSIVASLLAAVALVIGARQASAGRRAVGEPLPADLQDPPTSTTTSEPDRYAEPDIYADQDLYVEAPAGTAAGAPAYAGAPGRDAADDAEALFPAGSTPAASTPRSTPGADSPRAGSDFSGPLDDPDYPDGPGLPDDPDDSASPAESGRPDGFTDGFSDGFSDTEPDRAAAYSAGQRDTDAAFGDASRAADRPGPDVTQRLEQDADPASNGFDDGTDRDPYSGTDPDRAAGRRAPDRATTGRRVSDEGVAGDYDQASSMIGGARAEDDASWRRAPEADSVDLPAANSTTGGPFGTDASDPAGTTYASGDERPVLPGGDDRSAFPGRDDRSPFPSGDDRSPFSGDDDRSPFSGDDDRSVFSDGDDRSVFSGGDDRSVFSGEDARAGDERSLLGGGPLFAEAESGVRAGGEADDFGDPDPDDPDDEPLPQKVRPADAVRVARLDADVVVVDGRPRYHVPDCPHLSGRQTEGLPVAEAVELGFSPCGQCRPVDRLVAAAARR